MNNKTVLIFDDDADILEVCSIILTQHGYTVRAEKNCDLLEEKIAAASPSVIFMDNQILPNGGITASRQIHQSTVYNTIPIVFFSANKDVATLAQAAGTVYFIEKPFDLEDLVAIVERVISEHPLVG